MYSMDNMAMRELADISPRAIDQPNLRSLLHFEWTSARVAQTFDVEWSYQTNYSNVTIAICECCILFNR